MNFVKSTLNVKASDLDIASDLETDDISMDELIKGSKDDKDKSKRKKPRKDRNTGY